MNIYSKFAYFFEKKHQEKLKNYFKKLKIKNFIDVGSYEGEFLKNLNQENLKEIIMFEPDPEKFNNLKSTFKNYSIHNLCISSSVSKQKFSINKDKTTSTLSSVINKNHFLYKIKKNILKQSYQKEIFINVETLDHFFKNKKFENLFLKIDTEGSDYEVLLGATNFIKEIDFVLIEVKRINFYNNAKYENILKFMYNHKFKISKVFSTFPHFYQDILFEKNY